MRYCGVYRVKEGHGAAARRPCIRWQRSGIVYDRMAFIIMQAAATVAYMTKLFIVLFVEKNSDPEIQKKYEAKTNYCTKVTAAVLAITATILPILGVLPTMTL